MSQIVIAALLELLIGIAFCFGGYKFFRILLPLWGFLVGFSLARSWTVGVHVAGISHEMLNWIVGIIIGIICAILAYSFYYAAVVLMCASVGYWFGWSLIASTNGDHGWLPVLVGLAVAVVLALIVISLNLPKLLIILLSALGGASAIIASILLFMHIIPDGRLQYGAVGAIITGSWIWGLAWLILAIIGCITQWQSAPEDAIA